MQPNSVEVVFSVSARPVAPAQTEGVDIFSYHAGPVKVPGPWKRGRPRGTKKKTREPPKSRPQFEFIHLSPSTTDIDQPAQKRIRSHARRRRTAKPAHIGSQDGRRLQLDMDAFVDRNVQAFVECYNLRQIDGVDPFNALPIHFEPYMHDLLVIFGTTVWKSLYTLESAVGFNPFVEYGLPLGFTDPAILHTFICCADTFISYFSRVNDGARGLWHLQRAISIVNRRIAETTAAARAGNDGSSSVTSSIDSSTLIMVGGIAMFELCNGHTNNWKVHMQGLKQLVHHCGGIETFYVQPYILQKIFRADLYGSLGLDEPPFFDGRSACSDVLGVGARLLRDEPCPRPPTAFHSAGFEALSRMSAMDPTLCYCICQLEEAMLLWARTRVFTTGSASTSDRVAALPTSTTTSTANVATQLRYMLTGVQYMLLSDTLRQGLADTPDPRDRCLGEICRVALILFSLTVLNERPSWIDYGLPLIGRLRAVLAEDKDTAHEYETVPLRVDIQLWALFLAISFSRGGDIAWTGQNKAGGLGVGGVDWLLEAFAGRLASLPSPSTPECDKAYRTLQARLQQFLWVPGIHDDLLQKTWTATTTAALVPGFRVSATRSV